MKFCLYTLTQKIWYKKSLLRFFLWPFSLIFGFIVCARKILYDLGIKKSTSLTCPVIVIGNITVGGTGKTPVVIALANFLRSKGYHPGIISRGYKGNIKLPQFVNRDNHPHIVGDEAVLLARRTNCPVVVCPNRVAGAAFLLKETNCNIILSDDGLQHLALQRTIEIAVIDNDLKFGNGFLLPAGPLRESKTRLNRVDFCIFNGKRDTVGENQFSMQLIPGSFTNLKSHEYNNFLEVTKKKWHAISGIGSPERFFNMLKKSGLTFTPHVFPDHHPFTRKDFDFLKPDEWIIMTEKDAVKCEYFADERYWYMPVHAQITESFFTLLLQQLSKAH